MRNKGTSRPLLYKYVGLLIISASAAHPTAYVGASSPSEETDTKEGGHTDRALDGGVAGENVPDASPAPSPGPAHSPTVASRESARVSWAAPARNSTASEGSSEPDARSELAGESAFGASGHRGCCDSTGPSRSGDPPFSSTASTRHFPADVHGACGTNATFCSSVRADGRSLSRRRQSEARADSFRGTSRTRFRGTPFKLSRYILLLAYSMCTLLTSGCFFGWPSISNILYRQQAFAGACVRSPGVRVSLPLAPSNSTGYLCVEQQTQVQTLYSVGTLVYCTVAVLAGLVYGRVGPRIGAGVGQLVNMLGWTLLTMPLDEYNWAAVVGIALIGASVPLTSFPQFCVRNLFPGYEQVVVMLLSAAVAGSVVMPLLVDRVGLMLGTDVAIGGFVWLVIFPCLLASLFLLPNEDFPVRVTSALSGPEDAESVVEDIAQAQEANSSAYPSAQRLPSRLQSLRYQLRRCRALRAMCSRNFLLLLVYRIIVAFSTSYYLQSSEKMLSEEGASALAYVLATSPAFCLLFGAASLRVPLYAQMVATTGAGVLSFALPFSTSRTGEILSALSFSLFLGTALPQTMVYLGLIVDEEDFPPLSGVLLMVSGLLASLSAPVYSELAVRLLDNNMPMQIGCIVLLFLQYVLLFFMEPR